MPATASPNALEVTAFTAQQRRDIYEALAWHHAHPQVMTGRPADPDHIQGACSKLTLTENAELDAEETLAAAIAVVAYTDAAGYLTPANYSRDRRALDDLQGLPPREPDRAVADRLADARKTLMDAARGWWRPPARARHEAILAVTSDLATALRVIGGTHLGANAEDTPCIVIEVEGDNEEQARKSANDICAMARARDVHATVDEVIGLGGRAYTIVIDIGPEADSAEAANVIGAEVIDDAEVNPDGGLITVEVHQSSVEAATTRAGALVGQLDEAGFAAQVHDVCREG